MHNLLNQTFGRLTVIEYAGVNERRRAKWLCRCSCGTQKVLVGLNLRNGDATSCGCYKVELLKARKRPRGPKHSHWKGGRSIHNGYVFIWVEEKGVVREHTHVMEQHLNRKLYKDESIHHKNGIRDDNRLENLELRTRYHGNGQAVEDKVEWATELLKRYAPERLMTSVQKR